MPPFLHRHFERKREIFFVRGQAKVVREAGNGKHRMLHVTGDHGASCRWIYEGKQQTANEKDPSAALGMTKRGNASRPFLFNPEQKPISAPSGHLLPEEGGKSGKNLSTPFNACPPDSSFPKEPTMNNMLYLTIFLGVMTAMAPLSTDMYLPSLPEIASDFHISTSMTQSTLTMTMVGMAVGQVPGRACLGPAGAQGTAPYRHDGLHDGIFGLCVDGGDPSLPGFPFLAGALRRFRHRDRPCGGT